jgi:hypothetical protein
MHGARKRSAAWAGLLLAVLLVAAEPAVAARAPITGKLSKPGFTVIAMAGGGKARSVRATTRPFTLRPPAERVTLHLRAANGTYAGPVVAGVRRGRAVVGFRAGARLGRINVRAGYARVAGRLSSRAVDATRLARARRGVPIGARVFGRVRSKPPRVAPSADRDVDGVPSVLDIDDDGDLVLDSVDPSRVARAAQGESTVFSTHSDLGVGLENTANANLPGATDQQIEAALPAFGRLDIHLLPGGSAELDCGRPQVRTDPTLGGLVYCTRGGTGRVFQPGVEETSWPRFPDCCDGDGDGFGTLTQTPGVSGAMFIHTGATAAQIGTGDVLIQRVTTGGVETQYLTALQFVFATTPALVSYDDGAGNSATVPYPVAGAPGGPCVPNCPPQAFGTRGKGFPVKARPNGQVIVRLTFWRPQRRPIPGETGTWIDIGGLLHHAGIADIDSSCPQSAYSNPSSGLNPTDPAGEDPGFRDAAPDRPASPANTFAYTLNLTRCFSSPVADNRPAPGFSFDPGQERGLKFESLSGNSANTGEGEQSVFFERQ